MLVGLVYQAAQKEHTVRVYFFVLRRIRRGTVLDKLEEREGSIRIAYSRESGGWFVHALNFFFN